MKHFRPLFVIMLMAYALGISSVWADSYSIGWGGASDSQDPYKNFTTTSGDIENVVSFSSDKESSSTAPTYNANSKELRLYYNANGNGGSITLTPAQGVTITGFVMTCSTEPSVKYFVDNGNATSISADNKTYSASNISATASLKIQNANTTNTQLRIKAIKITYTKSSTPEPTSFREPLYAV